MNVQNSIKTFCMKATFVDEKAALKRIAQIKSIDQKGRTKPSRAYYCETCGGWHLTKKPDRRANHNAG